MPVTILALSNDNLSNLSSAAGRFGKFFTQGGQIRTLGGAANDGKNCEGKCYDPSLPDECLSAGIGRNSKGVCYNCSRPISLQEEGASGSYFVSGTNIYDYNESWCTPYATPIPAPTGEPIQSTLVSGGCNKCVIHYDFPPYDPTIGGRDYNGPDFYNSDCQKAITTKPGCTGGSPAPKDTYPTAVKPQSTTAPSNSNQTCNPGEWETPKNCGKRGCFANDSARCKSDGSGWECIGNPALCG